MRKICGHRKKYGIGVESYYHLDLNLGTDFFGDVDNNNVSSYLVIVLRDFLLEIRVKWSFFLGEVFSRIQSRIKKKHQLVGCDLRKRNCSLITVIKKADFYFTGGCENKL